MRALRHFVSDWSDVLYGTFACLGALSFLAGLWGVAIFFGVLLWTVVRLA